MSAKKSTSKRAPGISWKALQEELDRGAPGSLYLFTGPEAMDRAKALDRLREILLPPGLEAFNETLLESPGAGALIEACETLPVLADRRLVIARDLIYLKPTKAEKEGEEEKEAPAEARGDQAEESMADEAPSAGEGEKRLLDWLEDMPPSCVLVVEMRDAYEGRRKLAKAMEKLGRHVHFGAPGTLELYQFIEETARDRGNTITRGTAGYLVNQAGESRMRLSLEMDKLCAYARPGKAITNAMVDKLVTPAPETTVFRMIDRLMEGRVDAAFRELGILLGSGENHYYVLYMLTRQMRLLTHVGHGLAQEKNRAELQRELGLTDCPFRNLVRQSARIPAQRAEQSYERCVRADLAVKSGKLSAEEAVERLMFALAR
jgi:DNA polymerase-3 subunit delta